ncbi:MAG: glycosyltransferase family 39 protein [Anaerolineales bacterium]
MLKANHVLTRVRSYPLLPDLLSLAGGMVYVAQTFSYIFTSRGMLDEGLYLLKGWFYATGQYAPFQDYGPLTNHMPLAFLIPGSVMKWFGANLLSGRVYAAVLGLVGLACLWWLARRLSGKWWAAFAVWGLALNVALVRIYSLALSQVLVAALLILVLLLSVRRNPTPWQLGLAGALCGAMLMVRINMFPFAILWVLYIFWQHSRRLGLLALGSVALVPVLIHIAYWPNILRMWAYWIPEGLIAGLEPFYTPWDKYSGVEFTANWAWLGDLDDRSWNPIVSFWQGLRFNFVVMVGVLLNLLLWPKFKSWPDTFTLRTALFLNSSYLALTAIHMWASLGGQSCHEFCFSGYMAFFSSLGLLAVVVTAPHWRRTFHPAALVGLALALLLVAAGLGFGSANTTGRFVAEFELPRLGGGDAFPLWGLMENKFGMDYRDARRVLPAVAGFALAAALLLGVYAASWLRKDKGKMPVVQRAWLSLFTIGFLLAPTPLLSAGDATLQCGGNLPQAYADLGEQLRQHIQPGDLLYYHGPNSPAILMYLPGVRIFPQQLNGSFSFNDENPESSVDDLLRFGYWNQEIKESWIREADYILVEERRFAEWQPLVARMRLDTVLVTQPIEACVGKGSQQVLLRVPHEEQP